MQRRAAAIYVAFFLVIGAASYTLIATAQAPAIEFDNPAYELSQGDEFQAGGQTYNVTSITAEVESGGHGGGSSLVRSGELSYVNQSATYTATWENNSTVTVDDTNWTVVIPNTTEPGQFTLREDVDEAAILQQDPQADNETITRDGQQYVVVTENGTSRLVPAAEYFPDPQTRQFQQGQTFQYEGNQTTISGVTADAAELQWTAPRQSTIDVEDKGNVTLSGQQYLAHFPDNSTLQLTQNYDSFERQTAEIDTFHTQENGLWGVTILSGAVAVFLVGLAYLPSRY
jgi:hypothetical protein